MSDIKRLLKAVEHVINSQNSHGCADDRTSVSKRSVREAEAVYKEIWAKKRLGHKMIAPK